MIRNIVAVIGLVILLVSDCRAQNTPSGDPPSPANSNSNLTDRITSLEERGPGFLDLGTLSLSTPAIASGSAVELPLTGGLGTPPVTSAQFSRPMPCREPMYPTFRRPGFTSCMQQ